MHGDLQKDAINSFIDTLLKHNGFDFQSSIIIHFYEKLLPHEIQLNVVHSIFSNLSLDHQTNLAKEGLKKIITTNDQQCVEQILALNKSFIEKLDFPSQFKILSDFLVSIPKDINSNRLKKALDSFDMGYPKSYRHIQSALLSVFSNPRIPTPILDFVAKFAHNFDHRFTQSVISTILTTFQKAPLPSSITNFLNLLAKKLFEQKYEPDYFDDFLFDAGDTFSGFLKQCLDSEFDQSKIDLLLQWGNLLHKTHNCLDILEKVRSNIFQRTKTQIQIANSNINPNDKQGIHNFDFLKLSITPFLMITSIKYQDALEKTLDERIESIYNDLNNLKEIPKIAMIKEGLNYIKSILKNKRTMQPAHFLTLLDALESSPVDKHLRNMNKAVALFECEYAEENFRTQSPVYDIWKAASTAFDLGAYTSVRKDAETSNKALKNFVDGVMNVNLPLRNHSLEVRTASQKFYQLWNQSVAKRSLLNNDASHLEYENSSGKLLIELLIDSVSLGGAPGEKTKRRCADGVWVDVLRLTVKVLDPELAEVMDKNTDYTKSIQCKELNS